MYKYFAYNWREICYLLNKINCGVVFMFFINCLHKKWLLRDAVKYLKAKRSYLKRNCLVFKFLFLSNAVWLNLNCSSDLTGRHLTVNLSNIIWQLHTNQLNRWHETFFLMFFIFFYITYEMVTTCFTKRLSRCLVWVFCFILFIICSSSIFLLQYVSALSRG